MATANVNVRIDENLKHEAEMLFSDLGLNMSTAITMFLRCAVNNDGIPFEIKRKTPNKETLAAMADVRAGKNLSKTFDSVSALMEDLNA